LTLFAQRGELGVEDPDECFDAADEIDLEKSPDRCFEAADDEVDLEQFRDKSSMHPLGLSFLPAVHPMTCW